MAKFGFLCSMMLVLVFVAPGCKKKQKQEGTPKVEAKKVAADTLPPVPKFGIAACDVYFEKVGACIKEKVPAADRAAAYKRSVTNIYEKWTKLRKAFPGTDASWTKTCEAALKGVKAGSMLQYKCTW